MYGFPGHEEIHKGTTSKGFGAQEAGLQPILINPQGLIFNAERPVIESIRDLSELIL